MDMLRNEGAIGHARIAQRSTIGMMTVGHVRIDGRRSYGYGLFAEQRADGERIVYHSGGHKGVAAYADYLPGRGIVCAALTNLASAPAGKLWTGCVNAALGLPFEAEPEPEPVYAMPPERLSGFTGEFHSEEGVRFSITRDGDGLRFVAAGERVSLRLVEADAFSMEIGGQRQLLRFERDAAGTVTHAFHGLRLVLRSRPDVQ